MLLVCVIGCAKQYQQYQGFRGGAIFEVDGTEYWLRQYAMLDQQERVVSSALVVRLYPYPKDDSGKGTILSERLIPDRKFDNAGIFNVARPIHDELNKKHVSPKTDTLYFVYGGTILLQKEYKDLDIDAQQLSADIKAVREYLQPILETLIREHVTPQEPEIAHH